MLALPYSNTLHVDAPAMDAGGAAGAVAPLLLNLRRAVAFGAPDFEGMVAGASPLPRTISSLWPSETSLSS